MPWTLESASDTSYPLSEFSYCCMWWQCPDTEVANVSYAERWFAGWTKTILFSIATMAGAASTRFSHVLLWFSDLRYKYQPYFSLKCTVQSESQGWCTHNKFLQKKKDFADNLFLCGTSRTLVVMWVSFWYESKTTAYQYMGSAKKLFPPDINDFSLQLLRFLCHQSLSPLYSILLLLFSCFCLCYCLMWGVNEWQASHSPQSASVCVVPYTL